MNQNKQAPRRRMTRREWRIRRCLRLARNWAVFLAACGAAVALMTSGILWLLPKAHALIAGPEAFVARNYDGTEYQLNLADARLVLVNGNLPLDAEPAPALAVADDATGQQLEAEAAEQYHAMAAAAAADGITLELVTGYQDVSAREAAFDARKQVYLEKGLSEEEAAAYAACVCPPANASEQATGYAADILSPDCTEKTTRFADTRAYEWLTAYVLSSAGRRSGRPPPAWCTNPGTGAMWGRKMPSPSARPDSRWRSSLRWSAQSCNKKGERLLRRTEIAPGVHLSWDPAQKFNRCRISIHFAFPARRETATAHALLPLLMERGYADCPDMTQMTKKLARLYGADLTVDARPLGANHNLCVSVTGIKDRFALEGEALTREYAALALGTAFHPYFVGGVFDPEAVTIEKQMLKKALEDEINEKRIYCQRQANREFFGSSPAGIRQEGYLDEVDGLTPETLTEAYREMLRTASIELLVLGCGEAETEQVKQALLEELSHIGRAPLPLCENLAMPRQDAVRRVECFDTVQAKLCMLFTLGVPMRPDQMAAVRLAMALYGGSVTSRLFLNVRERDHLCYYCSSSFQSFTGSMAVNSGVEHADAARAEKAILKELDDLRSGPITAEELEDCRRSLLSGMAGIEDTLGGIETWYYMEVLRGGPVQTPDDARAALQAVTEEDVRTVLRQLTLSVSYLLTREEESAHA